MVGTKEYTFEELCRIVGPIAESYSMRQVYLFGSRARGDSDADSDYDFCVVTSDDCDLFELGGFFADLRDALGAEIDIVCRESLKGNFSREVLRDMRLLYEREPSSSERESARFKCKSRLIFPQLCCIGVLDSLMNIAF